MRFKLLGASILSCIIAILIGSFSFGTGIQSSKGNNDAIQLVQLIRSIESYRFDPPRFLFDNPSSIYDGINIHHVNTTSGNLSFRMRDLVTPGRIPIVFGRIYINNNCGLSPILGPCWRHSYDEYIVIEDDVLTVVPASRQVRRYKKLNGVYVLINHQPTSFQPPTQVSTTEWRIDSIDGFTQRYTLHESFLRLSRIEDRHGNWVELHYDCNRLIKIENSDAFHVCLKYDSYGRVVGLSDQSGRTVNYIYDSAGRLVQTDDYSGLTWEYRYGSLGLEQILAPSKNEILFARYDPSGKVQQLITESGRIYHFTYREFETTIRDDHGYETCFRRDSDGVVNWVRNANGTITTLEYDRERRVISHRLNNSERTFFRYDCEGMISEIRYSNGRVDSYQYDNGQVLRFDSTTGFWKQFYRDKYGSVNEIRDSTGFRAQIGYSVKGDVVFYSDTSDRHFLIDYSLQGWPVRLIDSAGNCVEMIRDRNGTIEKIIMPDGVRYQLSYNHRNFLEGVVDETGTAIDIRYAENGVICQGFNSTTNQISMVEIGEKDNFRQVFRLDGHPVATTWYNSMGEIADVNLDGSSIHLSYDSLGRLIGIDEMNQQVRVDYNELDKDIRTQLGFPCHAPVGLHQDLCDDILVHGWEICFNRLATNAWFGVGFDPDLCALTLTQPEPSVLMMVRVIEEDGWIDLLSENDNKQIQKILSLGNLHPREVLVWRAQLPLLAFDLCYEYKCVYGLDPEQLEPGNPCIEDWSNIICPMIPPDQEPGGGGPGPIHPGCVVLITPSGPTRLVPLNGASVTEIFQAGPTGTTPAIYEWCCRSISTNTVIEQQNGPSELFMVNFSGPGRYTVTLKKTPANLPENRLPCTAFIEVIVFRAKLISADVTTSKQIQIRLEPANLSGILKLELVDPDSHVIREVVRSGSSAIITESFSIPALAIGEYKTVRATWTINGSSAFSSLPYHIEILGDYYQTRYNTPTIMQCDPYPFTWIELTRGGCTTPVYDCDNPRQFTVPDLFWREIAENGSGYISPVYISTDGSSIDTYLSIEWMCPNPTHPTWANPARRFRQVPQPCPACPGSVVTINKTVAVQEYHPLLSCGDNVYVHTVGVVTVTDFGGGLAHGNNQLDHYSGVSGCNHEGGNRTPQPVKTIKLY